MSKFYYFSSIEDKIHFKHYNCKSNSHWLKILSIDVINKCCHKDYGYIELSDYGKNRNFGIQNWNFNDNKRYCKIFFNDNNSCSNTYPILTIDGDVTEFLFTFKKQCNYDGSKCSNSYNLINCLVESCCIFYTEEI